MHGDSKANTPSKTMPVVLIHGIARSHHCMSSIGRFLKKHGYACHNTRFHHWAAGIDTLAQRIYPQLENIEQPFHIVCHSLGGLIVRSLLHQYPTLQTGKIIMLGTPNNGSPIVNYFSEKRILGTAFKAMYSQPGQQMLWGSSYTQTLNELEDRQVHIIAGSSGGLNFLTRPLFNEKSDGTVPLSSTKLADHPQTILPVGHLWMLYDKEVKKVILNVLGMISTTPST